MRVIDFHCDTMLRLMDDKDRFSLKNNPFCVDIEKLKKGASMAQFFALWVSLKEEKDPLARCLLMIERFQQEMKDNRDEIVQALDYEDILKNDKESKISAFLTIEEGGVLRGSLENLKLMYEKGVRLITLTWNYPNEIGYPNCMQQYTEKGLTSFGKKLVEEMNKLHMLIDVSHLSDGGFYDVASLCKGPFVASHSNAREITPHSRNLTDDMIKILADKGGIMGLNFCSEFLGDSPESKLSDMMRHIKHIYKVGGIDILALGTDFDGIGNEVEVKDISEMEKLAFELSKHKFTDDQIENIFYKNSLRVIKEVL